MRDDRGGGEPHGDLRGDRGGGDGLRDDRGGGEDLRCDGNEPDRPPDNNGFLPEDGPDDLWLENPLPPLPDFPLPAPPPLPI